MKRFFALIATIFVLIATIGLTDSFAADKNLTFTWEQVISPDFAGWRLYYKQGSSGGGNLSQYTLFAPILYDGTELQEYESDVSFMSPDGQSVTYFFVLTAYDTSNNESGPSNEVSVTIDFEKPGVPVKFHVTIKN